jgi:putative component of membrane protein insertase Oxa1/YidC/SpoIIIJ protein YidD
MKILLIFAIHLYWSIRPEHRRRCCLFSESCSRHVFNVTTHSGLLAGLKALAWRFRVCRAGYRVVSSETGMSVILIDGTILSKDEISSSTLAPFLHEAHHIEERLMSYNPHTT